MPLFRIKHPSLDFNGVAGGVDFRAGAGTTSALSYVHGLAKALGCTAYVIEDNREVPIEVTEELNRGGAPVLGYRVIEEKEKSGGAAEPAPSVSQQGEEPKPEKPAKKRTRRK